MGDEMDRMVWPRFSAKAEREALKVLRSGRVNYWTGTRGREFEAAFAKWLGAKRALAVSSGTAALHLALEALGVGRGDDVVVTPYSFRASATAVANAGARPVFADVGPDHMLNARTIAAALTPRTRAVVVVHLYGQVADLSPILALARKRGIFVVEDCAQCLGGEYRGRKVGTLGDAGCFSFCQSKHITTAGEGGMVVCRSAKVAHAVESLRDHGWKVGSEPKEYDRIGYNARLTEIQSAVGLCELERLSPLRFAWARLADRRLAGGHARAPRELLAGAVRPRPEEARRSGRALHRESAGGRCAGLPHPLAADGEETDRRRARPGDRRLLGAPHAFARRRVRLFRGSSR